MKRLLILIMSILLLAAFTACGEKEPEYGIVRDGDSIALVLPALDGSVKIPVKEMPADTLKTYQLVRSDTGDQNEIDAAVSLRKTLESKNMALTLTTDWVKRGTEAPTDTKEILIGSTNRAENPGMHELRATDYVIKFVNDRLVICGGSSAATLRAMECFTAYFFDPESGLMLIPEGDGYVYREEQPAETFLLNGIPLWEYAVDGTVFGSSAAKESIRQFVYEATGYAMRDESEHKLTLDMTADKNTCAVTADAKGIRISGSEEVDISMAVRHFLSHITETAGFDPAKKSQNCEITLEGTKSLSADDIKKLESITVWVSPNGSDDGDGSESAPFATLNAARLHVRKLMKSTVHPIRVCLRGGDYYMSEPVVFDSADSGSPLAPITYCAADGETVNLYGGVKVNPALVKKAEDPAILARVLDKDAASKLMQIDLSGIVEKWHGFYSFMHTEDNSANPITVYINENPLDRSRWPNEGSDSEFLLTADKITENDNGSKAIYYTDAAAKRVDLWSTDALKDLYIFGFLSWDWYNEDFDASQIDTAKKSITLNGGLSYFDSIAGKQRYYFFNLPEEIDVPGESYVDRDKRIVYFLPEEDYDVNNIFVSTVTGSLLKFEGTKNIVIDGLNILYTRGTGIQTTDADNFTLRNTTIAHTSSNAASLYGNRITVSGCHIYDTARGGVTVSGGDRTNLISGESIVENCEIHDINRDQSTYKPGISASSFGLIIRNNKLYNCVHEMIAVGSNDVIIEYNEFFNCVTNSSDMGAIYFGRNPSLMGTVIRYNYFHQIGNKYGNIGNKHGGIGQQSIFIDDGNNGAEIYGNVFWEGTYDSAAVKTHGAQFSNMTNNIFIDMPSAYQNSDWAGNLKDGHQERWWLWVYDRYNGGEHAIIAKITQPKFDSEIWRKHYDGTIWAQVYDYIDTEKIATYEKLTDAEFKALAPEMAPLNSNVLSGNVMVNITTGTVNPYKGGTCLCENNYITKDTGIFKKYGEDFTLTDAALAEIRKTIPEFENIPFDKIGLQK